MVYQHVIRTNRLLPPSSRRTARLPRQAQASEAVASATAIPAATVSSRVAKGWPEAKRGQAEVAGRGCPGR